MKTLLVWLPFVAISSIFCTLVAIMVQQDVRISANYPQIQIAEDVSLTALSSEVDLSKSIAPFITVFGMGRNVIESTAVLHGSVPVPPKGVFDYARAHGEDRFTWQPEAGVRVAAVVVYHPLGYTGTTTPSFVMSGRSLREVEILESGLATYAFWAWLCMLIVTFVLSLFISKKIIPKIKIADVSPRAEGILNIKKKEPEAVVAPVLASAPVLVPVSVPVPVPTPASTPLPVPKLPTTPVIPTPPIKPQVPDFKTTIYIENDRKN